MLTKLLWVIPLLFQFYWSVMLNANVADDAAVGLQVTLRKETLEDAPSCVHTFAQLELMNLVSKKEADISESLMEKRQKTHQVRPPPFSHSSNSRISTIQIIL
jgi:hypothetical protein